MFDEHGYPVGTRLIPWFEKWIRDHPGKCCMNLGTLGRPRWCEKPIAYWISLPLGFQWIPMCEQHGRESVKTWGIVAKNTIGMGMNPPGLRPQPKPTFGICPKCRDRLRRKRARAK